MIEPGVRVGVRRRLDQGLERKVRRGDEVVVGELVAIHDGEAHRVRLFVLHDLEYHLLVVHGVEIVTDDRGSKRLAPQ